jgi:phenylacetic acid degradation operon negative regulatory protein
MAGDRSVADLLCFRAKLGSIGEPEKIVAQAWDLETVARAYGDFLSRFGRLRPKTPEAVFRAQTELVHTLRKFPFLDPDLPEANAGIRLAALPSARHLPGPSRLMARDGTRVLPFD